MALKTIRLKYIKLISYLVMSSVGLIMIMFFSNSYMLDKTDLLNHEVWFSRPVIDDGDISFTEEDLQNVKTILSDKNLYYYNQLSDSEKETFNYVYLSVQNRNKSIEFNPGINVNTLTKIVYILKFDCPEFFYLGNSFDYDIKGKEVITFYPEYIIKENEYKEMMTEVEEIKNEILQKVEEMSEYDTELYIHDYLTKNIVYSTTAENCNNLYGALISGEANCEGYSSSFMYLLRQAGIEATQVIGEINYSGEITGHSWNLVKIDGEYYYTDVCWDDLKDIPEYEKIQSHYAFFNLTYDEILETRNIDQNIEFLGEIPDSDATANNYYRKNNLFATTLDEAETIIKRDLPKAISSNQSYIVVKCSSKELYNELLKNITDIIQEIINEEKLAITKCKYAKIENGNTLIIHDFVFVNSNEKNFSTN